MDQHINVTFRMNGASHDLRIQPDGGATLDSGIGSDLWSAMEPEASISCVVNKASC